MTTKLLLACLPMFLLCSAGCTQTPEAKAAKHIAAGTKLLEKRDTGRAILEFHNAVQATPRNPEAYYNLGLAYLQAADYRSALAAFRKTLQFDPKHVGAKLRIAQMMTGSSTRELLQTAKDDLEGLMQNSAPTSEILNTLAIAEMKLGQADSAVEVLEKGMAHLPPELNSYVLLADAKMAQKDAKGTEDALKSAVAALPKSAEAHRVLAEFYLSDHRLPEAEAELRVSIGLDSKNGAAVLDMARLQQSTGRKSDAEQTFRRLAGFEGYRTIYGTYLFQDGRRDEAVREFERVVRENPGDRTARTSLLATYQALNRSADIDRVLAEALKKNPNDSDALLKRAEVFSSRGDYDKAEADLNTVVKAEPNMPEAHYLRAHVYKLRGSSRMYRQDLSETLRLNPTLLPVRIELAQDLVASRDGQTALDTLDAAPAAQKSALTLLVARNWALWAKGDMPEMRKGIDQVLALQRTPDVLIQDGMWKSRAGNPTAALKSLREALNMDPGNLMAMQVLNSIYVSQKNPAEALSEVKMYAARVPKSVPVQNFLAQMLLGRGETAQARAVLLAAKAAAPGATELELSLIQADYFETKYDDATTKLNAVLAANPKQPTALLWLGYIEMKRGNHPAAIDQFRKVLEVNPDDAQAGNDLAYEMAEHTSDLDGALKYAQHAVEIAPNQAAFADTLGWILYRKGLYPSALPYLEQANTNPNDVVAKYHLAMAYAKMGNHSQSVATLQVALKLDPNLPEARAARDLVGTSR